MLPVYLITLQCNLSNIKYIYNFFLASLTASLAAFLASDRRAFFRVLEFEHKCCCSVSANSCNSLFCLMRNASEAANPELSWPDEARSAALLSKSRMDYN